MAKKKEETNAELILEQEAQVIAVSEMADLENTQAIIAEGKTELAIRAEREKLITDTAELIGTMKGLHVGEKFLTVSRLIILKKIKEEKLYRNIPAIGTWENLCNYLGLSRGKVDENLLNLETFGEEFLLTVGNLGIGYRELRKLKKAKNEGSLSIEGESITVEITTDDKITQEVIPLSDKDELKDAIDRILGAKDRDVKAFKEKADWQKSRYDNASKDIIRLEKELNRYKTSAEIDSIPISDRPAYNKMQAVAQQITECYLELNKLSKEDLSDANNLNLHGTIMHMARLTNELTLKIPFFDGDLQMTSEQLKDSKELPVPGLKK